ncbi:unnamed protein product [Closterium sp. Naga37s-1]|nr:unnamed protein product [Closterium sp. Naga37s-1]
MPSDADTHFAAASSAVPSAPMTHEDEIFLAQLQAMLQEPCGGNAAGISPVGTLGGEQHPTSAAPAPTAPAGPTFGAAQAAADNSRRREHSNGLPLPLPLRAAKSVKTSPQSWPGSPVRAPLNAPRSALDSSPLRRALTAERTNFSDPRLGEAKFGGNLSRLASMPLDRANAAASMDAPAAATSPKRSASGDGMGCLSDEPQRSSGSGSASASPAPSAGVSAKNAATPGVSGADGSAGRGPSQLSRQQSGKGGGRFGQQIKPKSMTEKHRREKISEGMNRLRMVVDAHGDVASMLNYAVDYIQNMQAANKSLRLELLRRQLSCGCNASSDIAPGKKPLATCPAFPSSPLAAASAVDLVPSAAPTKAFSGWLDLSVVVEVSTDASAVEVEATLCHGLCM